MRFTPGQPHPTAPTSGGQLELGGTAAKDDGPLPAQACASAIHPGLASLDQPLQAGDSWPFPAPIRRRLGPMGTAGRLHQRTPSIHSPPAACSGTWSWSWSWIQGAARNHPDKELPPKAISSAGSAAFNAAGEPLDALELEHYPGMTRPRLNTSPLPSSARHGLITPWWNHRVGRRRALPGEALVLVAWAPMSSCPAKRGCQELLGALKAPRPRSGSGSGSASSGRWIEGKTRPFKHSSEQGQASSLGQSSVGRLPGPPCSAGSQQQVAPCRKPLRRRPGCLHSTPEAHRLAPPGQRARANSGRPAERPDRAARRTFSPAANSTGAPLEVLQAGQRQLQRP